MLGGFGWSQVHSTSAQPYRQRAVTIHGETHWRLRPTDFIPLEGALLFPNFARIAPLSE